jgi:hypothetical protein
VTGATHRFGVMLVSFPCQFTGALCVTATEIRAIALLCFGRLVHDLGSTNKTQFAKLVAKSSKERGTHTLAGDIIATIGIVQIS